MSLGKPLADSRYLLNVIRRALPDPATRRGQLFYALLLVVATLMVYAPALRAGYIWDDRLHLLDNPVLKPGGLAGAWVPGTYINYWPLTFSAYWLQNKLWGVGYPAGFHFVNILLHALSALFVWGVVSQVLGRRAPETGTAWPGLLAGAIFALHPVNVESVAWVTQLKNVLGLFFTLAALWSYLRYEGTGKRSFYVLAVVVFALSTLAKGIGLMLPAVLLTIAWWSRNRIVSRDVWRIVPFLLIAAVMASVEVAMQVDGEPWETPRREGFPSRLAGAGWCVWFYLYKLVWPFNLSFVYPRWTIDAGKLWSFVPDAVLVLVLLLAWRRREGGGRGLLMALGTYVAVLLPVLGFTSIYFMRYSLVADHWQYAAMIVPVAAFAATLVGAARTKRANFVVGSAALTILLGLGVLTRSQAAIYLNEETLWLAVLKQNAGSWMPHNNLGNWLANRGRVEEAISHYRTAIDLRQDNFQAHNNLGVLLGQLDRPEEAIVNYERALAINGAYKQARANLIDAYSRVGAQLLSSGQLLRRAEDFATAQRYFRRLTELAPESPEAHYGLGAALSAQGEFSSAVEELEKAIRLKPSYLAAHDLLARVLLTGGDSPSADPDRAILAAVKACDLSGCQDPVRLDRLAMAYAAAGRFDDAVATEDRALELVKQDDPNNVAEKLRTRRSLFRAGKAVRSPLR